MKFADAPNELERILSQRANASGERGEDAKGALRALRGEPSKNGVDPETGKVDPLIDEKRLNGAWVVWSETLTLGSKV